MVRFKFAGVGFCQALANPSAVPHFCPCRARLEWPEDVLRFSLILGQ